MKKFITITFGLLILSLSLTGQSNGFTTLLDENIEYVVDMIYGSDDQLIVAGYHEGFVNYITALDNNGEIEWSHEFYGEILWFADIVQKANGNVLIPMSRFHAILLELNHLGDSVGSIISIDSAKSFFGPLTKFSDSLIFCPKIVMNTEPFFTSVDQSFIVRIFNNVIEEIHASQVHNILDLTVSNDNSLFALAVNNDVSAYTHIVKYNLQGEILNTGTCADMDPHFNSILSLKNGYYIAVGYHMSNKSMHASLTKFDETGSIAFCKEYAPGYFLSAAINEPEETLYVLHNTIDECTVYAMDYNGDIHSSYVDNELLPGNVMLFRDNYLYIAGTAALPEVSQACVKKIEADSILAINDYQDIPDIKVYPNPAADYVSIQFYSAAAEFQIEGTSLQILNTVGREVARKEITAKKTVIDLREWQQGIYFYRIYPVTSEVDKKGQFYSGKFIVQR